MTIRDRIFDRLDQLGMTQKEFSEKTGIPQTTVSDWRKKRTNPSSEKIMVICKVLDVDIEWLLCGVEGGGDRSGPRDWYAIELETDCGRLVTDFNSMDKALQARLLGYAEALREYMNKQ
ncbi:MAG: helix-turn-helix domain-containing protein [Lachnospiraceae bacterium]|jgi:transcriptional regulator with XRE-family HTH domain|nr:helix-turn-helix domain-containing protein [Lachnospiraceae bacterium]MBR5368893.1 helix-turn-helix domain-containing protein [Lachnospiraceae bacterium]MCR4721628.1 helix-turn-helix domain-containing protein [Lachnospiraceae bacterium]